MANPWTKKNPVLSLWLSAASAWAGAGRGLVVAEWRRQATTARKAPGRKKRRKSSA